MRGLFREFVAGVQARHDEHDRTMTLAWHVVALDRQKKLPALDTLFARRKRQQTPNEMRTVLHMLSDQYGGRPQKAARRGRTHGR